MIDEKHGPSWLRPAYHWTAATLLGVGIVLAVTLDWIEREQVKALKLNLVEFAVQLTVVGIIGGLIKRAMDEHEALVEFRTSMLAELGKAHCQIYALRRALALRGHDPEVVRECVFQLMNIRNELGNTGHVVRTKRDLNQGVVVAHISVIRAYLEELIDEAMDGANEGKMTLGPKLGSFIAGCRAGSKEADAYLRRFKAPYLRAKSAVDPTWVPSPEQLRTMAMLTEPAPDSGDQG